MMLLTDALVPTILVAIVSVLWLFYYYLKSPFNYWKKRGIPYVKPSIFFGNVKDQLLLRKNLLLAADDVYKELQGERFGGYYQFRTPVLMVRDPELVEKILIKDFSHFTDREFGLGVDTKKDPLSGNLFNLKGQMWKNLRNKLTPTFTTGKLKGMMDQMCNCGDELIANIKEQSKNNTALNAKKVGMTFATDIVSSVSFGLQFKHDSPEANKFRQVAERIFAPSGLGMIRNLIVFFLTDLAKFLGLRQVPTEVNDYFIDLVKATIDFRKKNNIKRNDFLQLMINLKEQEATGKQMNWKAELSEEDAYLNQMDFTLKDGEQEKKMQVITDECIAAQSFVFLSGGSETLSNALQFTLFELARNPNVQTKLQQEIDQVMEKYGGKLTYEGIKEMTYLDLVTQGLVDLGEEGRKPLPGSKILLFMARGLVHKWKMPVAYYIVDKSVTAKITSKLITNCVSAMSTTGLDIKAVVCDQSSTNRKAAKLIGVSKMKPFFLYNNNKIYLIYDFPHVIKCVRNNLNKAPITFQEGTADWRHVQQLYDIDRSSTKARATKLTDKHLKPNCFEKMSVKLATQVMSHSVSSAMMTAVQTKQLPAEAEETAIFLKRLNDIFDSMNSNSKFHPNPHKCAISDSNNLHLKVSLKTVENGLQWVQTWVRAGMKPGKRPPSFDGFEHTLRATIMLWKDFKKSMETASGEGDVLLYLMTGRLNQDPLENEFSIARQRCGYDRNPTAQRFRQNLRHRIQTSLLKPPAERFRKYSEAGFLQRVCNSPYLIPDTNIVVEKGTKIVIPMYSIHNDPAFYPEPDKFIPERFEGNNHRTSGTYLPFGDGPRVCIAMRFVILEMKVAVAKLMSEFMVTLDPRTKVPLEFDPKSFVLNPKGGIWIRFHERAKKV